MQIRPFKAFRYNPAIVGDAGNCIAPPYDIITSAEQKILYEKSPYNIIRITKGKTEPSDTNSNNRYTRAAEYLKSWTEKGILKQDTQEAIYAYTQNFELAGQKLQRFSFIAKSKLEPFGKIVKPHEQTFDEPLADRLKLITATGAVFGLVLMLYEDPQQTAEEIIRKTMLQDALLEHLDEQNTTHRLFAITNRQDTDQIVEMLADKSCIIADGHHRYTTAIEYARRTNIPATFYQMLAFANINQQGLVILASHRLLGNIENFSFKQLIESLRTDFDITEHRFTSDDEKKQASKRMLNQTKKHYESGRNSFGIYGGDDSFYAACLKNKQIMTSAAPERNDVWRTLDVSVLQKLVFEKQLGFDENEITKTKNIEYYKNTHDITEALIWQVDTGQKQLVFFMNPVKLRQLINVVNSGLTMPQKSTYFYPKIYSGLTIDKL
jgi:uncharacterized protein (DUF1015 family)